MNTTSWVSPAAHGEMKISLEIGLRNYARTSIVTYTLQVCSDLARALPEGVGRLEHEEVCKRFDGGNRDDLLVTNHTQDHEAEHVG